MPAVLYLSKDKASRDGKRPLLVPGPVVLLDAQQHILVAHALTDAQEPAAMRKVQHWNIPLHQLHHGWSLKTIARQWSISTN